MDSVASLSQLLLRPEAHLQTLHSLLNLSASGTDITSSTERILRHVLYSTSLTPSTLSLSLDILLSLPSHPYWVDTLSILIENLKRKSTPSCLICLQKLPTLPHLALQHILLYATTPLIDCLLTDPSPAIRNAAVHAVATCVLRKKPLTAPSTGAVRLGTVDGREKLIKGNLERLLYALLKAVFDPNDQVAAAALGVLTRFSLPEGLGGKLDATREATACVIWDVLVASCERIGDRFERIIKKDGRGRKEAIRAVARLATKCLRVEGEELEKMRKWGLTWVDGTLCGLCENSNVEMSVTACSSLLMVCGWTSEVVGEKAGAWGVRAVQRLVRILGEVKDGAEGGVVREAVFGLGGVSKKDSVTSKFVRNMAVGLLPYAKKIVGREERLKVVSVLASTVVEYDLSGRDVGVGVGLKAVVGCKDWGGEDVVCAFGQALLESSRKIFACPDREVRDVLTGNWAVMLAMYLRGSRECLKEGGYAREVFLKVFDALGQYVGFLAGGMEEYERVQEMLVKEALEVENVGVRAGILGGVTRYWLTSGMKAEANAGIVLRGVWKHLTEHFKDEEVMLTEIRTGALWSDARKGVQNEVPTITGNSGGYISMATMLGRTTRAVIDTVGTSVTNAIEASLFGSIALATAAQEGSTLTTDYAYSSVWALIGLVAHNPSLAERAVKMLNRYINIMEQAESADFIVLETVRNAIAAAQMYLDEFFPKPVLPRALPGISVTHDPLAWLGGITESCIFASSRLEDMSKEAATVSMEESVLRAAAGTRKRMGGFQKDTLKIGEKINPKEGDAQALNGSSDPFAVVASHSMDTVKGLALIRVEVINRSQFKVADASLTYAASGALMPLPDAATVLTLGSMDKGENAIHRITLSVRRDQGYAGRVFLSVRTSGGEQNCAPYYVASSDVLLLRRPAENAGVDVFRRRWDMMRYSIGIYVLLRREETVDGMVDTLERRSGCLRLVGRMRTYSHVCTLVADSSRGDYVAVAAVAPEARGKEGAGECMVYMTIRSASEGYNRAFREECREWLGGFKVIFPEEEEERGRVLKPQDAYFITDDENGLSPYERWRAAHAIRVRH